MAAKRWVDFWLVDAFAGEPFQGNPAGVVLEAEGLEPETMRLAAREVGASETAFLLPAGEEAADFTLRWFTATCEVPFCGHATLATAHVLAETGRYCPPAELTFFTRRGPLQVRLCPSGEGSCTPMVQTPAACFEPCPIPPEELAAALLTSPEQFHPDLPLLKDDTHLFVPFRRLETLLNLYPDFRRLSRLGLEYELTGFACFTTETREPTSHWHMRFFAPAVGINEDPVTGAAQGPMAVYLLEQGVLSGKPGQTCSWVGEQGEALQRRGWVQVEVSLDEAGHARQVYIGGPAVTVLQGRLRVG
ncbi:MAG: PhzF family phenazine biosynthesis protein [Chloroflexia bacterium]